MADRYRGLEPGGPEKLGHAPLAKGQASAVVRIRAERKALAAFKALTAEQRGDVVERWHAQR
jgi:hypothetical protein